MRSEKKDGIQKVSLSFIFTADTFRLDKTKASVLPAHKEWKERFGKNRYKALFYLGFGERPEEASASFGYLHLLSEQFLKSLTAHAGLELAREEIEVDLEEDTAELLLNAAPYGIGSEYITKRWLEGIYRRLTQAYVYEISQYEGTVEMFLAENSQNLKAPERIFFHLVENKKDFEEPFAFLATYATKDETGKLRHMPLQYALTEYKHQREKLLELLSCLNRAAEKSPFISQIVESGEMFYPLQVTADEAYEFLKAIPAIEETGILCRIPNWWKKHYASPSLSVSLGEKKPALLGFDSLISVQPKLMACGVELSREEIKQLLSQTEGLAWLKGRWVEVDHRKLKKLLEEMQEFPEMVTLKEALRMDLERGTGKEDLSKEGWAGITNGTWLATLMRNLRMPGTISQAAVPKTLCADLRPYQKTGYTWLSYMARLGFGACLADDMGLGKTVQVIAFLEKLRNTDADARVLLAVPASLLGNWRKEIGRFAPAMDFRILHGRAAADEEQETFLTITTYGMVSRLDKLKEQQWTAVILDEAQAIKNPATKQTREVKKLRAGIRIAMTGTPIENDLTNLWSLFDYLNPGLMGNSKEFHDFAKGLESHPEGYGKLKNMVNPFILRRLKSDKSIIADLPDKLERVDYAGLSKKQIVLYRKQVAELAKQVEEAEGIQRKGIVLSAITKLKQICNHPDQFLGQEVFEPSESGKFQMLQEICQTIYEKRERVLVFTQYKEMTEPLAAFLEQVMGQPGLVLHGGTRVGKRAELVDMFNGEEYIPFMVLSVKAGGTGLNLTAANHVIHFDRWWNPAVENQATDRAYRIGQDKNVVVHKLVSEGTIEEKIDQLINAKKELADNVIGKGGENWITEMNNEQLLAMMRLEL